MVDPLSSLAVKVVFPMVSVFVAEVGTENGLWILEIINFDGVG